MASLSPESPGAAGKEERLLELLGEARELAREYYELTARPLGITGEIAE